MLKAGAWRQATWPAGTKHKAHDPSNSARRATRARPGRIPTLELAFDTELLRTTGESETHAKRELGARVAETLKHRLADLRAATSVKDLVAGGPRELHGSGDLMAVDLCDGYRIVFCANHPNDPMTGTGGLDWARVSRIKIMRIEMGHD